MGKRNFHLNGTDVRQLFCNFDEIEPVDGLQKKNRLHLLWNTSLYCIIVLHQGNIHLHTQKKLKSILLSKASTLKIY